MSYPEEATRPADSEREQALGQGSQEWFVARLGKVTASRVSDVVAKTKTGWGASRANYAAQLVAERLTNTAAPSFINEAMRWGTEKEPEAKSVYSFVTGLAVAPVGFVGHRFIEMAGASPDGFVGDDGLIEVKAPLTATHIETLLGAAVANKYLLQMQWQMACTGRQWCDFVSYDPRMPGEMQLHVRRVARDYAMIASLELEVAAFLREVEETVSSLVARYRQPIAAE
jgi:putative phage-type endonuclease